MPRGCDHTLYLQAFVPGRGQNDGHAREWLATTAEVPGFIRFAVGREVSWDRLVARRAKKMTREAAVGQIARRYREFVDVFGIAVRPVSARTNA
jgi:myo-inositol catabolism protein IolC